MAVPVTAPRAAGSVAAKASEAMPCEAKDAEALTAAGPERRRPARWRTPADRRRAARRARLPGGSRLQLGERVAVDGGLLPVDEPGLGADPLDVAGELGSGAAARRAARRRPAAGPGAAGARRAANHARAGRASATRSRAAPRRVPAKNRSTSSRTCVQSDGGRSSVAAFQYPLGPRRSEAPKSGLSSAWPPAATAKAGRARRCGTGSAGAGCPRRGLLLPTRGELLVDRAHGSSIDRRPCTRSQRDCTEWPLDRHLRLRPCGSGSSGPWR